MELLATQQVDRETNQRALGLPPEILVQVFSILSSTRNSQPTLHSCTLVSRLWYSAAVQALYESPHITGKNFNQFVNTVCPSINFHVKKNGLADMVKRLNMSMLVYDGSKSLTARILRRCKENLEEFVAPQASFAINSFAALSKCTNLRHLDLSFIAYTLDLDSFMSSIKHLDKLERLHFPPSCRLNSKKPSDYLPSWPMNLRELHIPGNLGEDYQDFMINFPPSLTHVTIGNCPHLIVPLVLFLMLSLGHQLESLEIKQSKILLGKYSLNELLPYLPVLRRLSIPAEHINTEFFTCASELELKDPSSLVELELTSSNGIPLGEEDNKVVIDCNHVWGAVVDGRLGRLRRLKVHRNLKWDLGREGRCDLKALDDMLQALAREDAEASGSQETIDSGVWIIGK